jgi:hypothetical protein
MGAPYSHPAHTHHTRPHTHTYNSQGRHRPHVVRPQLLHGRLARPEAVAGAFFCAWERERTRARCIRPRAPPSHTATHTTHHPQVSVVIMSFVYIGFVTCMHILGKVRVCLFFSCCPIDRSTRAPHGHNLAARTHSKRLVSLALPSPADLWQVSGALGDVGAGGATGRVWRDPLGFSLPHEKRRERSGGMVVRCPPVFSLFSPRPLLLPSPGAGKGLRNS